MHTQVSWPRPSHWHFIWHELPVVARNGRQYQIATRLDQGQARARDQLEPRLSDHVHRASGSAATGTLAGSTHRERRDVLHAGVADVALLFPEMGACCMCTTATATAYCPGFRACARAMFSQGTVTSNPRSCRCNRLVCFGNLDCWRRGSPCGDPCAALRRRGGADQRLHSNGGAV